MASFQVKIGWEKPRKRENKKNRSVEFLPDPVQRIQKNRKKIQKIKKHHYDFISSQNKLAKAKKEGEKKIVPMNSYPNRNREFQKNSQKIQKIKIPHYGFFLTPKQVEKGRERKKIKKKNHLDEFLSHPE